MNPEESAGALSYLGRCWGGELSETDRLAFMRLFAQHPVTDVMQAIDDFLARNAYRPKVAELAARLRAIRADAARVRGVTSTTVDPAKLGELYGQPPEPWPPPNTTPAHASAHFQAARELAKASRRPV